MQHQMFVQEEMASIKRSLLLIEGKQTDPIQTTSIQNEQQLQPTDYKYQDSQHAIASSEIQNTRD
jgi:hypothetical protein